MNSHFDSGNIEVHNLGNASGLELAIHKDPFSPTDQTAHFQWFNFRITGAKNRQLVLSITNAGKSSYPGGWVGYQARASYDLQSWFTVPTSYDAESGVLRICHTPKYDAVQYAYFAPYSLERHTQFVHRMQMRPDASLMMIGETLDGHDIDVVRVGEPGPGKKKVWIVARQHPGESMAEWFCEGLLERATSVGEAVARALREKAVLYVIPNINPDGTWRGHLRTNAAGVNLNRAWAQPTLTDSPEVLHARDAMDAIGVDLLLDVHGDEALPYVFLAGAEGTASWDQTRAQRQEALLAALQRACPDVQTKYGYPVTPRGRANMGILTNQASERYGCLAMTLEMPFKDNANSPDPQYAWSPERSAGLGAASLSAILQVLPLLQ